MGERAIAEFKGPDGEVVARLYCQFGMPDRKMPATLALIRAAVGELERPFTMAVLAKKIVQLAAEPEGRGSYAAWEEREFRAIPWNAIEFVYSITLLEGGEEIEIGVRDDEDWSRFKPNLAYWTKIVNIGQNEERRQSEEGQG